MQGVTFKLFTARRRQERFPWHEAGSCLACVAWEHHQTCGGSLAKTAAGSSGMHQASGATYTARDLKVNKKIVGGKNDLWETSTTQHSIKQKHYVNTFLARRTLADVQWSQIPKAEVQEGQWFLLPVVWFSQQRQEVKVFYLGTNPFRCKHVPEEGDKDKVQKPGPNGHFSTRLWLQTWVGF